MVKPLLETISVRKQFGNFTALNNVSISVPENSIYGLLGPNGAGKTTLIRIINQITAPDSGEVLLNGDKLKLSDVKNVGYLPEERGLYKKMKVGEQAIYLAQLKGLSLKEAKDELKYWFTKLEMQSWWDKKIEELSKGMQQKVQFVTTVVHKPKLLIFDEPFSGFDPINASILKDEILELKKKGATIIFSTHNMSSVEELCDNIALINKAEKVLEGNMHDIKRQHFNNELEVHISYVDDYMTTLSTDDFKIIDSKPEDNNILNITYKVNDNLTSNDLLQFLIPKAKIHHVSELIPSMNEVFISVVNKTSGKQNQN
ncbi:MAG: ATP-binding cassette domain-containing protein [Bacteroidales bacterium]